MFCRLPSNLACYLEMWNITSGIAGSSIYYIARAASKTNDACCCILWNNTTAMANHDEATWTHCYQPVSPLAASIFASSNIHHQIRSFAELRGDCGVETGVVVCGYWVTKEM